MEVRELNERLHYDPFLGKGTLAVSEIFFTSPSRCAVADSCAISIDRRLTDGETYESALEEIRALPSVKKYNAEVSMYKYDRPSYTGLVYPTDCYFPTGSPEDHIKLGDGGSVPRHVRRPRWISGAFSTNGVSSWEAVPYRASGWSGKGSEACTRNRNRKADL